MDPHYGKIVEDGGDLLHRETRTTPARENISGRVTDRRNLEESNRFFAELVEEIHRRGMRIILDGVFNHCGSFNKWNGQGEDLRGRGRIRAGAYVAADSPYRSYFDFRDENGVALQYFL